MFNTLPSVLSKDSQMIQRNLQYTSLYKIEGHAKNHTSYKFPVHQQQFMKVQLFIYWEQELLHKLTANSCQLYVWLFLNGEHANIPS